MVRGIMEEGRLWHSGNRCIIVVQNCMAIRGSCALLVMHSCEEQPPQERSF